MIRFNNDYNRGAMECVMNALTQSSPVSYAGYGEDTLCREAVDKIRALCAAPEAAVHFLPGATQTNFTVISAALSSVQSVISADTGHINCHEAASIENTGHKILELPNTDGKISAEQVRACAEAYYLGGEPEYLTEPKMVYISFPTEQGTIYSLAEISGISSICRQYGMYLFVDGARLPYGLCADGSDITLPELARYADAFYLGGTKCGALFGEALVITSNDLKRRFKAHMKQNGAVLAKGWLLGLQFSAMLENGEYFSAAKRANEFAVRIREAFENRGVELWVKSPTNQQFVIVNRAQKEFLAQDFIFEEVCEVQNGTVIRFCASWATGESEIDTLTAKIAEMPV